VLRNNYSLGTVYNLFVETCELFKNKLKFETVQLLKLICVMVLDILLLII